MTVTGGEHGDETVVGGGGELLGRGSEEDWEEQEACTNTAIRYVPCHEASHSQTS